MTTCNTIRPTILRCMEPGELAGPVAAFIVHLTDLGYSSLTISGCAASARHFRAWLKQSGIPASKVDDRVLNHFAQHQCRCAGNRRSDQLSSKYVRRVRHFVRFLAEQGVVTVSPPITPPLNPSVALFMDWLRRHRGLSERTIDRHARMVSRLLPALGTNPGAYDAKRVRAVILAEGARCSSETVKAMTTALRTYLRYLATNNACRAGLDYAVPSTPVWRRSALPRYLPPTEVERLIASCDMTGVLGIRDKAILLLLARLGLRAHDVWAMELDDVDWANGMVRVCGKG